MATSNTSKTVEKRCDNCGHGMEHSYDHGSVFCIERSPSIVILPIPDSHEFQTLAVFPTMRRWAKCDRFKAGPTQKPSTPDHVH